MFSSPRTNYLEFSRVLSGCESILDVGCGANSPLRFVPCRRLVGVDAYGPDLIRARNAGTHDEFVEADARSLSKHFTTAEFDACVALDVIEHLTKEDGIEFLGALEMIARQKVVIFTPKGFVPQSSRTDGDHQEHLSGWDPDEMRALGYDVIGLNGLKCLRGELGRLRFRPAPFWAIISWLTQHLWCRRHPSAAAAILCTKKINGAP